MSKFRRLYFDCETSPCIVYSWRVGRRIDLDYNNIIKERAIICICWKWEDEDHVWSLQWNNGDDAEMLREFMEVINESDEVISHNGDRFDIPWLRTRCIKHGIPCFPKYKSIDTLKIARSGFNFNSNRLDYISKFIGGKAKLPTDFNLWKRVMAGDKKALTQLVAYCRNDVLILEEVYHELSKYVEPKTNIAVLEGGESWHCPHCKSTTVTLSKTRVSAFGIKRHQLQCSQCGRYFTVGNTTYNKFMEI
jgi:hypothetical protein